MAVGLPVLGGGTDAGEHTARTTRRPHYPKSFAFTDSVCGIEAIFAQCVSVCIWRRPVDPEVQHYVQVGLSGAAMERTERIRADRPNFDSLLRGLPESSGRAAFVADVAGMLDLISTLSESKWVGVRLLVTREPPCPRFHVDRLDLRLICTWQGAGTEWLAHDDVDRGWLGARGNGLPDEQSGLLLPGAQIHRMRPFDIGIFKGELWPENIGRGAVHRSPRARTPDEWRIMMSIEGTD